MTLTAFVGGKIPYQCLTSVTDCHLWWVIMSPGPQGHDQVKCGRGQRLDLGTSTNTLLTSKVLIASSARLLIVGFKIAIVGG